ncbi:MAG: glycosyltransferase family 2 protein [bacterium]
MKISIIIVSWQVRDLLEKCLQSILKNSLSAQTEIFVVDNNSDDGTIDMVREKFSSVKVVANKKNLGFAMANNIALRQATGDYILFLNPDTELFSDTLQKAVDFMTTHKGAGMVGCRLVFPDGSFQPSVRRFPTWWPIFLMLLKLPKFFSHLKPIEKYLAVDFDYEKEGSVDQVMGAFMFTRQSSLKKVGEMDERFFIWFDDADFCLRFWTAGEPVYYTPSFKIIHYQGKSFAQQKVIDKQWNFFHSAWQYFIKHGFGYPNFKK